MRVNIVEAVEILRKAGSPIILAGGGVIMGNASSELTEFAEALWIPSRNQLQRQRSDKRRPSSIDRKSGRIYSELFKEASHQADVLIALGYRFTDVSTEGWKISPQCKIIQIDLDPVEIGKNFPADVGIVGNVKEVLPQNLNGIEIPK